MDRDRWLEAEEIYKVRVGMEAIGHARWFERLIQGLQFELRIGDAAEIRTKRVRKQKTDRQDVECSQVMKALPSRPEL